MSEQLRDVEGVYIRFAEDLVRERQPGVVQLVARRSLHDGDHVGLLESGQRDPLDSLLPA